MLPGREKFDRLARKEEQYMDRKVQIKRHTIRQIDKRLTSSDSKWQIIWGGVNVQPLVSVGRYVKQTDRFAGWRIVLSLSINNR